jgi:diguanylate cyclase (GGDEF)-like protein
MISKNGKVFGILSRKNLLAAISRPFGRDVFIKRSVIELEKMMDTSPLVLPHTTKIATALKEAMSRPGELCFEPLLVRDEHSIRLLEVNILMTAQANLLEQALHAKDRLIEEVRCTAHALHQTIDEQKRLARALSEAKELAQHEAMHDALTGLPNRKLFLARLEIALSINQGDVASDCAVLFIDLDRFKIVNDSLGHLAGNALLQEVARRLNTAIQQHGATAADPDGQNARDTVARLSGDEFTVLLTHKPDAADVIAFSESLQAALGIPFSVGGESVVISASIGVVASLAGYDNTEAILRDADIAMYRAKDRGKACVVAFEAAMREQVETRLHIENRLRAALGTKAFELHYQPIVNLSTGAVHALEALVRWRGQSGLIYPGAFIDIAEETGLIVPLGNWVFHEACAAARQWHDMFPGRKPVNMSINLSAVQFGQNDLVEVLRESVQRAAVRPEDVTIEITERSTMADPDRALAMLKRLKAIGFRLAIDDFGTGYSSLSYLHRFPIDILKIDRSFVSDLAASADNGKIIAAILALADSLGITVVAEGVETQSQMDCLRQLGCKFAQGYLFAKPQPAELIAPMLASDAGLEPASA